MLTTLNLELSRKIFELVGGYATEKCYIVRTEEAKRDGLYDYLGDSFIANIQKEYGNGEAVPAPNFAEVIREVLPRLGRRKKWKGPLLGNVDRKRLLELTSIYMSAPTEKEGMEQVEKYLNELL